MNSMNLAVGRALPVRPNERRLTDQSMTHTCRG